MFPQQKTPAVTDEVLVVTGHVAQIVPVKELTAEYVRAAAGDFPRSDMLELVKPEGGRLFLLNTTLPARVEAQQVRNLRENAALQSLFTPAGTDGRKVPLQVWVTLWVSMALVAIALFRG